MFSLTELDLQNFAKEAREQCDVLQRMGKKMEMVYQELAEYFVFDPQKYTLDEFFTDIKTFKDSFHVRRIVYSTSFFLWAPL